MTNPAFPSLEITPELVEAGKASKAWPFEEARKIVKRYQRDGFPEEVIFETGYGPSGLPHIGTFGEVARTTMVVNAFRLITEDKVKVRLICFSDDMDGMRKVPDNVPNPQMLRENLQLHRRADGSPPNLEMGRHLVVLFLVPKKASVAVRA